MKNQKLRDLFSNADSISINDDFIRYFEPEKSDDHLDEFEIVLALEDSRFEFTSESIDKAMLHNGEWTLYCSNNEDNVCVKFYKVEDITCA